MMVNIQPSSNVNSTQPSTSTNANDGSQNGQYAPLGVWIANWSDLFPWLSTAALNSIDSIKQAEDLLLFRTVIQDFDALRKIYYNAHYGGLKVTESSAVDPISFREIANSFSTKMNELAKITDISTEKVNKVIDGLAPNARKIYDIWAVELDGFLRNCELGLGVIVHPEMRVWGSRENEVACLCYPKPDEIAPYGNRLRMHTDKISFNPYIADNDYSVFSESMKCIPIILPASGAICLVNQNDPMGILTNFDVEYGGDRCKFNFSFSSSVWEEEKGGYNSPRVFQRDNQNNILRNKFLLSDSHESYYMDAYPIPFRAAEGVEWKGRSVSTNVASFQDLFENLDNLSNLLKDRKTFTFSSENLPDDWKGTDAYSIRTMDFHYVGIVPEAGNIFPKTSTITSTSPNPTPTSTEVVMKPDEIKAVTNDTDDSTNVRSGQGTTYEVITTIKKDEVFYTIPPQKDSDWWPVRTSDGKSGYIAKSKIKLMK